MCSKYDKHGDLGNLYIVYTGEVYGYVSETKRLLHHP